MFKSIQKQLLDARRENEALRAELNRANANLGYIAMMTDTELDEPEENEALGEER